MPETPQALPSGRRNTKDLNFKVSEEFHREVRLLAALENITMIELLRRALDLYKKKHGTVQQMMERMK